jgi:hypothetical protein
MKKPAAGNLKGDSTTLGMVEKMPACRLDGAERLEVLTVSDSTELMETRWEPAIPKGCTRKFRLGYLDKTGLGK